MEENFEEYSKFGGLIFDENVITLKSLDRWFRELTIDQDFEISRNDIGVFFGKFRSKTINFEQFKTFLSELVLTKRIPYELLLEKVLKLQKPGAVGMTVALRLGGVTHIADLSEFPTNQ